MDAPPPHTPLHQSGHARRPAPGDHAPAVGGLRFTYDLELRWRASAQLSGDALTVTCDTEMSLSDFEDARFLLVAPAPRLSR